MTPTLPPNLLSELILTFLPQTSSAAHGSGFALSSRAPSAPDGCEVPLHAHQARCVASTPPSPAHFARSDARVSSPVAFYDACPRPSLVSRPIPRGRVALFHASNVSSPSHNRAALAPNASCCRFSLSVTKSIFVQPLVLSIFAVILASRPSIFAPAALRIPFRRFERSLLTKLVVFCKTCCLLSWRPSLGLGVRSGRVYVCIFHYYSHPSTL